MVTISQLKSGKKNKKNNEKKVRIDVVQVKTVGEVEGVENKTTPPWKQLKKLILRNKTPGVELDPNDLSKGQLKKSLKLLNEYFLDPDIKPKRLNKVYQTFGEVYRLITNMSFRNDWNTDYSTRTRNIWHGVYMMFDVELLKIVQGVENPVHSFPACFGNDVNKDAAPRSNEQQSHHGS